MDELIVSLTSGISTILLLFCRRKQYDISWKQVIIILLVVGGVGYFGAIFGSWLSYGSWRGIRFYGKALFVTFTLIGLAKLFKKESTAITDYYGPVDILALVIMKINCYMTGCCAGIDLYVNDQGERITFPSQIAELLVAAALFALIIILEKKKKCNGYRYYLYLLIYGITRFIFDYFRVTPSNKIFLMGAPITVTQIFCAILMVVGIIGIYHVVRKNQNL